MFVVEYFHKFRELYTTRENKNHKDMSMVASKHCTITSSQILLSQSHMEHYLQVSLLMPLIMSNNGH